MPKENLIGKENKGFKYIMWNFNSERLGIVVQANRFARVCIEESIKVLLSNISNAQDFCGSESNSFLTSMQAREKPLVKS